MQPQISQSFIKRYMNQLDDDLGDTTQVASTFTVAILFRSCLPSISEATEFNPLLDPLAEQPSDHISPAISASDTWSDSLEDEKPPQRFCFRRRPVQLAQQLESELCAARLGFCSE